MQIAHQLITLMRNDCTLSVAGSALNLPLKGCEEYR